MKTMDEQATECGHAIPLANQECGVLVARWILRMLLRPGGCLKVEEECLYSDRAAVLTALGLRPNAEGLTGAAILDQLSQRLATLDRLEGRFEGVLARNLARLQARLALSDVERDLVGFAVLLEEVEHLRTTADRTRIVGRRDCVRTLASVLGHSPQLVHEALRRGGHLFSAGLLKVEVYRGVLTEAFNSLNGLGEALLYEQDDLSRMFATYFSAVRHSHLTVEDYPHLREDTAVLRGILGHALGEGATGVNILLYGEPGTGKSELVRALSKAVGGQLYEVAAGDEDGDPQDRGQRFRAFQLGQRVLAGSRGSLMLFDEIEDVFKDTVHAWFGRQKQSGLDKAWTNRLLESNPVPAFWVSNGVGHIDPAFLRRFTYTLNVPNPPLSVRRMILDQSLRGIPVTADWIARMAKNEKLTPAQIQQAARVATLTKVTEPGSAEQLVERLVRHSCEIMGQRFHAPGRPHAEKIPYCLEALNPSQDLARVVTGLRTQARGRLCLYGPPGTGKTAFAEYLARELDQPLLKKGASDILDQYVGGTEANIATMFRQAEAEGAVLLLDEADSFLQDRRMAQRTWEITQVNELLVQMEAFDGLFICSTNLMDQLDSAVFRRFDLKIRFDYLTPDQAWNLFARIVSGACESVPSEKMTAALQNELGMLTMLTPGDFATVVRQFRVMGEPCEGPHLLAALREECRIKQDSSVRVSGFVA